MPAVVLVALSARSAGAIQIGVARLVNRSSTARAWFLTPALRTPPPARSAGPSMDHGAPDGGEPAGGWDDNFRVRPYTMTGGRTRPRSEVAIIGLCREWCSVAEISALLRLPLGVTRVLIADMAYERLLRLHQANTADSPIDLRLLERVLDGLRKL